MNYYHEFTPGDLITYADRRNMYMILSMSYDPVRVEVITVKSNQHRVGAVCNFSCAGARKV